MSERIEATIKIQFADSGAYCEVLPIKVSYYEPIEKLLVFYLDYYQRDCRMYFHKVSKETNNKFVVYEDLSQSSDPSFGYYGIHQVEENERFRD